MYVPKWKLLQQDFCVTLFNLDYPQIQMATADEVEGCFPSENFGHMAHTKEMNHDVLLCHHTILYVDIKISEKYVLSIFTLTETVYFSNILAYLHTITQ
jgi:hypothetical protein